MDALIIYNYNSHKRSLDLFRKLTYQTILLRLFTDAPHEPSTVLHPSSFRWPVSQGPVCVFERDRLYPQEHVAWPVGRSDGIKRGGSVELLFCWRWNARGDSRALVTVEMHKLESPLLLLHSALTPH